MLLKEFTYLRFHSFPVYHEAHVTTIWQGDESGIRNISGGRLDLLIRRQGICWTMYGERWRGDGPKRQAMQMLYLLTINLHSLPAQTGCHDSPGDGDEPVKEAGK